MQIFVKAAEGRSLAVDVGDGQSMTVRDLKRELEAREGIAVDDQLLTYGIHSLDDDISLFDSGIQQESTIFLSFVVLGGGKKRKKKVFTKPKKVKHKKKKVKLAVLKFYKVDGNDKVTRLRRECPADTCGSGVFMGEHFNRNYCGRCGLTYIKKKEEEEKE